MTEGLRFLVLLACVFTFIACIIGGLLILFERWTPKNRTTRPFLVTGVLASAIAAVTPQGGNLFGQVEDEKGEEHPAENPDIPISGTEKVVDSGSNASDAVAKPRDDTADEAIKAPPEAKPTSTDAEVAEWARANLPSRPILPKETDGTYPPCASFLRAKDIEDIAKSDAGDCYNSLDRFNTTVMLKYQVDRASYIDELKSLSLSQSSVKILDHLRSELSSFTDAEGKEFRGYTSISNKFLVDLRWLARLK